MEKAELIHQLPLFHGVDVSDLQKLSEIATEERIVAGTQIFSEGSKGDSLYIVKSGTVRVIKRGTEGGEEVSRMGPGQHFGEMAVIDDGPRSATVDALETTELVRISRDALDSLVEQDEALGYRIYKALARFLSTRLRQTTSDLIFIRDKVKQRTNI